MTRRAWWSRRPRTADPDPYTKLDHLDGLPQRAAGGIVATGGVHVIAAGERVYPLDRLPGRTRYDAEWPSVLAAEAPGGDLAAMAAPLPGMARDALGTYAEYITPMYPMYRIEPDGTVTGPEPVPYVPEPMPRHAFDRIMADLASLDREMDAFDDGRAYETGSRCRTDSAALRRATEHLAAPDGARRAALVLAGFTGADAWAV